MTAAASQPSADGVAAASRAGAFASRTVVAVALVAGFGFLAWADATGLGGAPPAWWLLPIAVLVAWAGADEAGRLLARNAIPVRGPLVGPATAAVVLAAEAGAGGFGAGPHPPVAAIGWAAVACMVAALTLGGCEIVGYRGRGQALVRWAAGTLVTVGLGMPLAFLVGLRLLGRNGGPPAADLLPLLSTVAVVKGGDIAAYCVGSLVGRHKMAPALSPGKTWEGAAAALTAATAVAWLLLGSTERSHPQPWGGWIVYGLAVGAAGMLGDLGESLVKRELGVKDSGRSLGGLGGVLDLVDALLIAAPVAWILWVAG